MKYCDNYDDAYTDEASNEQNISIVLNGEESELRFISDRKGTKVRTRHANSSSNRAHNN